ncbi:hypothetical protein PRUPE_1G030200 [Prunus persica]|uniref:DNA-directed RNA polymerase subunit n=2 Tax=Prunus persica TaxID=3760 RepID=A0A251QRR4_PRUPE|nr:DNA-directed RNA polymerase V subunit 7 isoform X1 [Prunus persica]XP_020411558.1 DNA-directed RNA polymerase V subunit 7 isoform X1 [Prunus persica]ONI26518.1 hypothetical protein PRUPE_1G030200 [Prunus persica]ONI26519.1 hypothetical protein PRUPE_1G030200 [Prunus persica]ONI26520.1 hypothetical protein PRUPE_1G030200 [Prunus persica]ONI26521.1 hypothetical protein PRUPE_1G030200 [Prunus persica]ONI26522.1 hypothetical protein PRUPE_1G030200 [Prunus persica]
MHLLRMDLEVFYKSQMREFFEVDLNMFYEVELLREVAVLAENLDRDKLVSSRFIVTRLLEGLLSEKADEDLGYFLAVTGIKRIGKGEVVHNSGDVFFPVVFNCRMFLPRKGEILEGVVDHVHRLGVFLRCGPVKYVFLSARKMPNYRYVVGEKPVFLHDDLARIEKDVVVRFEVFGVRWMRREDITKEFMMLATLQGDLLGPVTGPDGLDL